MDLIEPITWITYLVHHLRSALELEARKASWLNQARYASLHREDQDGKELNEA